MFDAGVRVRRIVTAPRLIAIHGEEDNDRFFTPLRVGLSFSERCPGSWHAEPLIVFWKLSSSFQGI